MAWDAACLSGHARQAVSAMAGNDWRSVPWAQAVGYAENSVGIRVGEFLGRSHYRVPDEIDFVPLPFYTSQADAVGALRAMARSRQSPSTRTATSR